MKRSILIITFLIAPIAFHAQSIVGTKHNLSAGSSATIKAGTESELCVFCHTPHSAQTTAPLWNRDQPSSTYTLYSSDMLSSLSYTSPSQPGLRSRLCLSCHDGTIAIGSVYRTASGTTPISMTGGVTTMPTGAGGNLGTDLRNDHPVGHAYSASLDPQLVTRSWPWTGNVLLEPNSSSGRIECITCHDAHKNQNGYFLQMSNSNAALCTYCHTMSGWSGSLVIHRTSTQTYTPAGGSATTIGEWACRSCHKSHGAGSGPYILRFAEEATCLQSACHGSSAPASTKNIAGQYSKTYKHPTSSVSGAHKNEAPQESASNLGSSRHAECWDCHNMHTAEGTVHTGATRDIAGTGGSGVLKGVWGVEPTFGTLPTTMTNNSNTWTPVTAYTVVSPAVKEYQICLKCHSGYASGSQRNIAEEIDPRYPSYHGIMSGGTTNANCTSTTLLAPWGSYASSGRIVWCSDCHGSDDTGTPPKGPHGSNIDQMLKRTITSDATNGTPLCNMCHNPTHYWSGTGSGSRFTRHPNRESDHKRVKGCFTCHMYDFNSNATYGGGNYGGNTGAIFVHGMNKRYYWRERVASSTIAQSTIKALSSAFIAGYVADIDFTNRICWTETPGNAEFQSNCNYNHNSRTY
ncbi:MAG: hypothetical protein HY962_11015 [Ignavibacteriae bacterium]|nr:hypothetical protein [Ignavibacteriota bacterium]